MDELEFFIPTYRQGKLEYYNIFRHRGVRWAISMYRTGKFDEMYPEKNRDWCMFIFGDFWYRAEYEMEICGLVGNYAQKVDAFSLCIKPNEKLLWQMVDSVSKKECTKFLAEWNKRLR